MKELDKTKEYYLGNLDEDQRGVLYDYLLSIDSTFQVIKKRDFTYICNDFLSSVGSEWYWTSSQEKDLITDALELFEEEPKEEIKLKKGIHYDVILHIGDTFEHEGFICEVKEKIEEKKWIKVIWDNEVSYDKMHRERFDLLEKCGGILTEITDQEFIKQLEKNSK